MKHSFIFLILFGLSLTSSLLAQTPDAELGIWGGTVVVKKNYAALGHVKTSTMTVIGYVDLGGNAGLLYGLITNLDSRENAQESTDQTIYLPVNHISEGGELGIIIGNASVYSGTVAPKTLRFTKKAATNKMVSLSYKI